VFVHTLLFLFLFIKINRVKVLYIKKLTTIYYKKVIVKIQIHNDGKCWQKDNMFWNLIDVVICKSYFLLFLPNPL